MIKEIPYPAVKPLSREEHSKMFFDYMRKYSSHTVRIAKNLEKKGHDTEAQDAYLRTAILGKHALLTALSFDFDIKRTHILGIVRRTGRALSKIEDQEKRRKLLVGLEQTPVRNQITQELLESKLLDSKRGPAMRRFVIKETGTAGLKKDTTRDAAIVGAAGSGDGTDTAEVLGAIVEETIYVAGDSLINAAIENAPGFLEAVSTGCSGCGEGCGECLGAVIGGIFSD